MNKKVLIVDDSILMIKVISDIINSIPGYQVCATARYAKEAIDKFLEHDPDLITLDFELPDHDGIWILERLFEHKWVPVVMVSAHTKSGAEITIRCLELGAADFITKPSGTISLDLNREIFAQKLNQATKAHFHEGELSTPAAIHKAEYYCVGIGSSTGGVRALLNVLPLLPEDFPGSIMVVQHMPKEFTTTFAQRLDKNSKVRVIEAKGNESIEPGVAILAPGDSHMIIKEKRVYLTNDPPIWGVRPAADCLFPGLAYNFGASSIGVIMTGMGKDGSAGIKEIKNNGGIAIAEDPKTAFISSMPRNAIATGCIDFIVPLGKIASKVVELASR